MNFNENYLLIEKTELLYLRISKLARAKVLLKLEFDTEDQVLFYHIMERPQVRSHCWEVLPSKLGMFLFLIFINFAGFENDRQPREAYDTFTFIKSPN